MDAKTPIFHHGFEPEENPPAPGVSQAAVMTRVSPPAQTGSIPLYADLQEHRSEEIWERSPRGELWVRNVTVPTLTPVLPALGTGNGVAVVVAPGGAFRALSVENEGMAVARWFADRGIAAFVLTYRLEPTPPEPDEYAAMIAEFERLFATGDVTIRDLTVPPMATADAQAAIRLIRDRALEWNIDQGRVGMIGFSAGAMTSVAVAVDSPPGMQPDFVIPIYPSMLAVPVPCNAPPMFLALASDDPLFGAQGYGLAEAWKAAGCAVEFHLFERGGHGFGMRQQNMTSDRWPHYLHEWMHMRGWAPPTGAAPPR
ncbi:MAG: alpha/beta hydrolase [Alphaproteobacteria bacterium]|nr:alpha/beta hydrolase [Alphaproteobacteria bacterium]MBU1551814.1 alpha/beta hydrolase [Alphaproteobacteria bacterium]MBU2335242.1 alpha/beta hydrolase [Alphaproteobacteria bacterium]MBU2391272.1 alpha/beta hydrolase [Alphaproteobacteria bacterium]